jgi:hypothetical protein
MKQRFTDYQDIPVWLVDYILTVADAESITDIALQDINDFLQGLEDYYDRPQDVHIIVGHDRARVSDQC